MSIYRLSIPAQESICILSDDYWAEWEKSKESESVQFVEGEGEKTVPASSAILYRKHSPLVGQGKRS